MEPQGLELWYFVFSIIELYSTKFVQIMTPGLKMAPPLGAYQFYIAAYKKIFKSSSLERQGLELLYFVYSIIYWSSTKFVQIMTPGPKMATPWGLISLLWLYVR